MAMFETVANGFRGAKNALQGKRELTEENIEEALKSIRMSLFQADVNYKVVKAFINSVKEKALGEVVQVKAKHKGEKAKVSPGDVFIKICHDELEQIMGPEAEPMVFNAPKDGPTKIMLVGLQGAGKTTTAGKLARWLMHHHERQPLLVGADVYRPAAIAQLRVLGERLDAPVFSEEGGNPVEVCRAAQREAVKQGRDVIIFDTAGRLAVDDLLMTELEEIVESTNPEYIYLVCDSMIGQDAVNTAAAFNERLPLSGFIMTKMDGDARGGAALSMRFVTGAPIKFAGTGEKLDAIEAFHPARVANRILGMGDVVSLVEKAAEVIDAEEADKLAKKMAKGQFDMNDLRMQLRQMQQMGGLGALAGMIPGLKKAQAAMANNAMGDKALIHLDAMIGSMTPKERERPAIINAKRKIRIAKGSGTTVQEVNRLLKMHQEMGTAMKKIRKMGGLGGLAKMFGGM
ncbi:MAG: signal recognition particle protein, partial [Myxococcales bacterium]|nr:signal recognition particle protein [Myxococcales bacterium]